MAGTAEIKERVALETERRTRLGVPAFAAGFLYIVSGVMVSSTLNGLPTVGPLQGIEPALRGEANPTVSPRAAEVKYISHHAFALIAGSALTTIALAILIGVLLLLLSATRFRRPEVWAAAHPLVLYGGALLAFVTLLHQVIGSIETHNFATGHDFSNHAVEQALTKGAANVIPQYVDLLAGLAFAAGMIATMVNAMRVGLLTRWMGVLGIFAAILIFLPLGGATLEVIPAFWLVAMGLLYSGRWPGGDPPAWPDGEPRPWPSQADLRAAREAAKGAEGGGSTKSSARGGAANGVAPAPAQPAVSGENRRRRKRRARR